MARIQLGNNKKMSGIIFRPLLLADHDLVLQKTIESWEAETVVAHGNIFRPAELPGLGAFLGQDKIGLLTYQIKDNSCEVITLISWDVGRGNGTRLNIKVADKANCTRMRLVTPNDNTPALHFFQKCGFVVSGIQINALASARRIKPEIPMTGVDCISLRDEIELEMRL